MRSIAKGTIFSKNLHKQYKVVQNFVPWSIFDLKNIETHAWASFNFYLIQFIAGI